MLRAIRMFFYYKLDQGIFRKRLAGASINLLRGPISCLLATISRGALFGEFLEVGLFGRSLLIAGTLRPSADVFTILRFQRPER
jgi:hypothetical protein